MSYNILITGGAGYVGSALVPELLKQGHKVRVLDLFIYGDDVLKCCEDHPNYSFIKGDLRDIETVKKALQNIDYTVHLACISNDPSFELNPNLGKSINLDSFLPLVRASKDAGCKHFIYASSSSVYGVKEEENVTENLSLEPLTDYSIFKAQCEEILESEREPGFYTTIIRPSTVCGYAPRQRLDVIVNILTSHAYHNNKMKIYGGTKKRPNIHIKDMVRTYTHIINLDHQLVDGKIYNVGYENHSLDQLANIVCEVMQKDIPIEHFSTDDLRSYHISSQYIKDDIGFEAEFTIGDAVHDLINAFKQSLLTDAMNNTLYYNVKRMQELKL